MYVNIYIYVQIESIRLLDCVVVSIFDKTVSSIFKTVSHSVLKTAGVLQSSFRSCSQWGIRGSCLRHPLSPTLPTHPPPPSTLLQCALQQPSSGSHCPEKNTAAPNRIHHCRDPAASAEKQSAPQGQPWRGRTRARQRQMANGLMLLWAGCWATVMNCWSPFLLELPCHPLTHIRTAQDQKLSHPLAWVENLALWLFSSLGFWPHICIFISILWLKNLPTLLFIFSMCTKRKRENFILEKLSKTEFSGGFLQLEILLSATKAERQDCYKKPKNQGKRHLGSLN